MTGLNLAQLPSGFDRHRLLPVGASPAVGAATGGASSALPADAVAPLPSNLSREVYCILGLPIDAVDLPAVVRRLERAAVERVTCLVSTPNLNFLVHSLSDPEFRQSLLDSDLCPPDGMPIIWIARLIGLPLRERASGADLLDRLRAKATGAHRLSLFLFGGATGVAAAAAKAFNADSSEPRCLGTMDPGFGEVDELSADNIINAVNSSGADFLVVSLGAKKGQLWLQRNHHRLKIPIRAHLGAAIGFQAGVIKRAPPIVRACGFEWLWRIKEERYLWKRYRHDGLVLLRLLFTRILPLAALNRWHQLSQRLWPQELLIAKLREDDGSIEFGLSGSALQMHVSRASKLFGEALATNRDIIIDLSRTQTIDARFFGMLMMLHKELTNRKAKLLFTGVTPAIRRVFQLTELGYLLSSNAGS
ncbi:WecB/TagA/CpsF family glycosyltransferase [Bradyrhizobium sp. McL0616]|uniref:WecB/TagA/CpsF family glycosyltransferase n=1 Tax=Bradyrhizobium sp. McL0616 TaxID=3415674 RepID=UPI003CEC2908